LNHMSIILPACTPSLLSDDAFTAFSSAQCFMASNESALLLASGFVALHALTTSSVVKSESR